MRIKSITIQNFISFKNAKIDFVDSASDEPRIYIIDGINFDAENDEASNGSGKSTLVSEAIMYNIFGKGLRGSKQKVKLNDMIRNGTSKMINAVEYFINNEGTPSVLTIDRTKALDGGSTTKVMIDGESKTKRTKALSDKDIKIFLDLNADVFSQVVVYYRDNQNLLAMNYSQRLEFFKNLVDLTIIDEYYDKFKNFKQINARFLERLNLQRKNTQEIVSIVEENKDKYFDFIREKIKSLRDDLSKELEIQFESTTDLEQKLSVLEKERKNVQNDIAKVTSDLNFDRKTASKIKDEIKKLSDLSGGKCPTCSQEVTGEYVDKMVLLYNKEYAETTELINAKIESLKTYEEKLSQIDQEIKNLNKKINEITSAVYARDQRVKNLKLEIQKNEKELEQSEKNTTDKIDKSKYEKRLENIEKAIAIRESWKEAGDYWCSMFAPKSLLRSVIIRKYITVLSDIFEYYTSKLYNNEILGKIAIDDDGQIDITLLRDGYDINYWQLSSGERKRIDIAMILSLYEFTSYLNPNTPKFLILDEIFDSLDYPGIKAVTDVLVDVQQRHKIDLFIISHIPIPLDNIPNNIIVRHLLVTKKDKCSSVKMVS